MYFVDLNDANRLFSDCKLEAMQSGNGVLKGAYRKPVKMGNGYYYYRIEGKNYRVDALMLEHFKIEVKCDLEWFMAYAASIEKHNAMLKKFHRETAVARDCDRKRKMVAMKKLLEGLITREKAAEILGMDTVEQLLGEEPTSGTMSKRKHNEPIPKDFEKFPDFTVTDVERLTAREWGFVANT
jgi:hypothetical protein